MVDKKLLALTLLMLFFLAACQPAEIIETARGILDQIEEPLPALVEEGNLPEIMPTEPAQSETAEILADSEQVTVVEKSVGFESDDPPYEIKALYPYLEGDPEIVSPFNAEMDYLVEVVQEVFINDVEESAAQRADDAMPAISTLFIDYEMTVADGHLYSAYLPITSYVAISAHPFTTSFSYNYDAKNGTFLLLSDLFISEADYLSVILPMIEEALIERDFGYQPGTAEDVMRNRANWNILPQGLRLNFDAYEVGPGAAGPQLILIPWEDLSGIIDFDGPAGRIIAD